MRVVDIEVLVQQARNDGKVPRVHGNGFIQLDLAGTVSRMHIWGHPDIPRQSITTAIHDHVFDFISNVLVGELHNHRYDIKPNQRGVFRLHVPQIRQGEDTVLVPVEKPNRYNAHCTEIEVVRAGTSYSMERGDFHETVVNEPTIAFMTKNGKTLSQNPKGLRPRVLVPAAHSPDNAFNRYTALPVDKLWQIVTDMLVHV